MPEQEQATKPESSEQTKPKADKVTKPDKGSDTSAQKPSQEDTQPSQDQISMDRYEAAVKAMNAAQRERAELEQRYAEESASRRRLEAFAQEQLGVARAATDPEQAAWRQYQEAKASYDPDAESAALQRYLEARDQKRQNALIETLTKRQRLEAQIPQAMQMLGVNDQSVLEDRLGRVVQTLTPADLALIELHRNGKLNDHLAAQQAEREQRARQADALKSLGGGGGGRVVPGSLNNAPAKQTVDWVTYRTASKAVREAIDANPDIEVVNVPED